MAGIYTVSQISSYLKGLFTRDFVLSRVTVSGEVSNCKYHSAGHIYFTLKDQDAALNCVMFQRDRAGLDFRLADGQQIEAAGQISIYEKSGSYQLYVRRCNLSGAGLLYERFLKLKEELSDMGMFDPIYKKTIPAYAKTIGIVTAPTGAAVRDIINVSTRRNPYVQLILYPALVQGKGAKESIVRGIRRLDAMHPDVMIVGRGGGSIEDLWAFNEEEVARAIFEAETPIISAVGHETDFTIADFAADLRAPTPSAAAELATFELDSVIEEIHSFSDQLERLMEHCLVACRQQTALYEERLKRLSPENVLLHQKERLSRDAAELDRRLLEKLSGAREKALTLSEALDAGMEEKRLSARRRLELLSLKLDAESPLKKMSRGFGYLQDVRGHAVRSVGELSAGDPLLITVADGRIESVVRDVVKT